MTRQSTGLSVLGPITPPDARNRKLFRRPRRSRLIPSRPLRNGYQQPDSLQRRPLGNCSWYGRPDFHSKPARFATAKSFATVAQLDGSAVSALSFRERVVTGTGAKTSNARRCERASEGAALALFPAPEESESSSRVSDLRLSIFPAQRL